MGADYTVRSATPEDVNRVSELLRASYSVLLRPAYDARTLEAALPYASRPDPGLLRSGHFFLAESPQCGLIGCGGWSAERPGTGALEAGLAHLRHFAVRPSRARSGVGRTIYGRCEETARAAGVTRFECYASLNAEKFYAALGLKTMGRFEVPMGDIVMPCFIMKRDIPPAVEAEA